MLSEAYARLSVGLSRLSRVLGACFPARGRQQEAGHRDIEIINARADALNAEAEDVLGYLSLDEGQGNA